MLSAVVLGVAEAALDEIVALANTGRRQQRAPAPMRESEMFQAELGRVEAELRAHLYAIGRDELALYGGS